MSENGPNQSSIGLNNPFASPPNKRSSTSSSTTPADRLCSNLDEIQTLPTTYNVPAYLRNQVLSNHSSRPDLPPLAIPGSQNETTPELQTSQVPPPPEVPQQNLQLPRQRKRGFSLRTQLFNRQLEHNPQPSPIELAEHVNTLPVVPSYSPIDFESYDQPSLTQDTFGSAQNKSHKLYRQDTTRSLRPRESRLPNYTSWASSRLFHAGIHGKIEYYYQKGRDFVFQVKKLPPSEGGRCIPLDLVTPPALDLIDERTSKPYVSNTIVSSIYTRYNAFPLLLFAQFSKLANIYFLVVSSLQMVPNFSTTGTYNSFITFMIFTNISMAREGFDDWQRHRHDASENNKEAQVARVDYTEDDERTVQWVPTPWHKVKVGDVVKLERNDWVPADLLLLHANGMGDVAFVETAALDGETNLKAKVALPQLAELCSTDELLVSDQTRADFVFEDPNTDLYNFEGNVTIHDSKYPLSNDNILYRGSILRNTPRAVGIVVFSGQETKIRMNASLAPRVKAPRLQGRINRIILFMVFFVVFIAGFCTVMERVWVTDQQLWYLSVQRIPLVQLIMSFIIMFNTLIPLSLYVSMEIVKLGQRLMLVMDIDLYHAPSITPCEAHTSSINEELGQVSYIFSDKTGTLTDNVMIFRKISVAGHSWLYDLDVQQKFLQSEVDKLESSKHRRSKSIKSLTHVAPVESNTYSLKRNTSLASMRTGSSAGPHWRSSAYGPSVHADHSQPAAIRSAVELLQYIQHRPNSQFSRKAKFFLLTIALCHTCLPDYTETEKNDESLNSGDEDSKIEYQASSPDELALVRAARDLGFVVIDRQLKSVTVRTYPNGFKAEPTVETYGILNTVEFSSARKRMSIVLRFPDGRICLLCKGADAVIFDRLRSAKLALEKKAEVKRRVALRKNTEAARAVAARESISLDRHGDSSLPGSARESLSISRGSLGLNRKETLGQLNDFLKSAQAREAGSDVAQSPRMSFEVDLPTSSAGVRRSSVASPLNDAPSPTISTFGSPLLENMVDESIPLDTAQVLERTMSHIDEFATEGLRTLVYAHKFLSEDEYKNWAKIYSDAVTSLVNRSEKIEAAGEIIETELELTGATAIEDKLQNGVPESIDKLRRAGIKLWMLTGDKRETAISIGHSCRLIHDYSTVLVLRSDDPEMANKMAALMLELEEAENIAHSVVVIDGATLAVVEKDMTLMTLFVDLGVKADSVICCRASPSQKALLVSVVRSKVKSAVTLAIGDGANDIAMIQAADVGIGIAGKEGRQAARSSDFSIGQFRFLLKLLLVHGRWNYVRLSKYVLATFYKEFFFYLTQAMFQQFTMYSGTSLYESTSLTMYNTLFTSLPVLCLGIFLQDLSPETLVAVPELYATSRLNKQFNLRIFVGWMAVASSQAVLVSFTMFYVYAMVWPRDNGMYPMGTLNFAAIIAAIAIKLNFVETHNRTYLNLGSILISVLGWFLWTLCLTQIYPEKLTLYVVKDTLIQTFGPDLTWWLVLFASVGASVVFDMALVSLRAGLKPSDVDVFQQIEQHPELRARLEQEAEMEMWQSWEGDAGRKKRLAKELDSAAARRISAEADEREIQDILSRRNRTMEPIDIVRRSIQSANSDGLAAGGKVRFSTDRQSIS
ncbi:hypothetical protein V1512DRAFT_218964 [Lipomyces arxii]|uniref:uncharacterized protein n=1 Tax=Lipomyces arxii TaxID=56418 RepID=UPI0034CE8F04